MSAKIRRYKKLGIWTATIATVFCSPCFVMAILRVDAYRFITETWLFWSIIGVEILELEVVWLIVIIMPNE